MPESLTGIRDAKTYYGVAGSVAATEMTGLTDVKVAQSRGKSVRRTRASAFERGKPTICVIGLDFKMPWDETDVGFLALHTAFTTNTKIAIKCLSKVGGFGVSGDWYVEKMDANQPGGDEEETADVTLYPASDGTNQVAFV